MIVAQLIQLLRHMPQDKEVVVHTRDGFESIEAVNNDIDAPGVWIDLDWVVTDEERSNGPRV